MHSLLLSADAPFVRGRGLARGPHSGVGLPVPGRQNRADSTGAERVILVTGGAGFIGSHTCVALAGAGLPFLILDNFCNSRRSVLERVGRITGRVPDLVEGDVRDEGLLARIFAEHPIDAVIHFAALKAVGESVREPLSYYDNNVAGTVALLRAMRKADVRTLVFSSSATVYGEPASLPIREDFPLSATNPYGQSKLMMEQVLATWTPPSPAAGASPGCATSTPWERTRAGSSAKTRRTFPTTCCPTWRRWPWGCASA